MKPDFERNRLTTQEEDAPNTHDAEIEGGGDDPNYLGRAWDAVKDSVGLDQTSKRQKATEEFE